MPTNADMLTAAFDSRDIGRLIDLMDARVVWRGIVDESHEDDHHHDEHEHEHEHEHGDGPPMCTDRDQVREVFEGFVAGGSTGHPVVLVEVGDTVVVDPRPEPALPFPLHQSFTFRGDRVVLIQDYPDRPSALADVGR